MAKERSIDDALISMNELIEMQQRALETADELLKLKDARLDIADRLIDIYRKEIKVLKMCFFTVAVLQIISVIVALA